jgi:hypothetical protein
MNTGGNQPNVAAGKGPRAPFGPPVILSPQSGDTVGPGFTVIGTYPNPDDEVDTNFDGATNPNSFGIVTDDQDWSAPYNGDIPGGPYTLTASAAGGSDKKDRIYVQQNQTVSVDDVSTP